MESDSLEVHIDNRTLNRFADGVLLERSAAIVRGHLRSCAVCRREVQLICALSAAIRAVPTPKPPDELRDELFPQAPRTAAVIPLALPQGRVAAFSRSLILSGACLAAVIVAVVLMTFRPDRVMAGASALRLEWETPGTLALEYETPSPLAAEPALRARVRFWVPDSLRFAQTEPGYAVVELSREQPGLFSGVLELPQSTAYAVAVVEDIDGEYIDTDFGRLWEYFNTDAAGRPTLQARRYQLLATSELSVARAAEVAEAAASEFPEQPEFSVRQMLFMQSAVPSGSRAVFLREHAARLTELDRAAREGQPGPVELDALHRYAALLGQPDLADYWSDQLVHRYPRHGLAALVRLQSIVSSTVTNRTKLEALEESWARTGAPAMAQVGLRLSIQLADPALTQAWLDRHSAGSAFRDLTYDTEVAGAMMILPALWPVVEAWILDGLAENRDEMGSDRPLDQSRRNFRAEANERRALLNIYLARLRLARGRVTGALDAAARAVEQTWNPDVFSQAAEIHRGAGSNLRAAELLALSRVDPITLLKPSLRADGLGGGGGPSEAQLSAARRIMYDRLTSALLDEPVGLDARLRSPTGRDTTLGAIVRGKPVLLVHASRPDLVPDDAFALLDANGERLRAAGVHTLMMAQRPTPAAMEQSDFDSRFYHDSRYEAWDDLRAWREVQYFVLDPRGRLRYRGEDLEAALRISFVIATREVTSSVAVLNRKEVDT